MRNLKIFSGLMLGVGIILLLSTKVFESHRQKKVEKERKTEKEEQVQSGNNLPDNYSENYILREGETKEVTVHPNYSFKLSGKGKKYYYQEPGKEREIWGDDNYHQVGDHIDKFYIGYFNEEVNITVYFSRL